MIETLTPTSLDELTRLDLAALEERYRRGSLPRLADLDGTPRGRMLAVSGLGRGLLGRAVRRFAASERAFPWAGKSFASEGDEAGRGINRVRLFGRREWYPFTTRIEPSVLDGEPCVLLDYDLPQNPWFIRRIRDELREVGPGLFLGPALLRARGEHRLALFFAIDHTGS